MLIKIETAATSETRLPVRGVSFVEHCLKPEPNSHRARAGHLHARQARRGSSRIACQWSTRPTREDPPLLREQHQHRRRAGTPRHRLQAALTRSINSYAHADNLLQGLQGRGSVSGDMTLPARALTCVLSVKRDPQFEGRAKTKLNAPRSRASSRRWWAKHLGVYFEENPGRPLHHPEGARGLQARPRTRPALRRKRARRRDLPASSPTARGEGPQRCRSSTWWR
ncbi:MAG: hypothetical protein H6741_32110 [Alphaproteobacteria bacterium]|nr:hypothetical protein [Alphaproteobacteria bacterium]